MGNKSSIRFFEYAACSTCRKARRWLDEHGVSFESVPIVERPPTLPELERLVELSGVPVARWFNTSGQSYRTLVARLGKEGLLWLGDREKLELLAADGKMIKRPVLVADGQVLVGFDEARYRSLAD
jgi:arsenate reductase